MVLNRVQLCEVCVLTLARACVNALYHVGMCFYAEIEIKPSPVLKTSCVSVSTVFTFTGCCVEPCLLLRHPLYGCIQQRHKGRLILCSLEDARWQSQPRLLLPCPFRDYVSKVRSTSPWRFGMTANTNYCSAASLSAVLSLSLCLTHSPQLMIVTAGNEEQNIMMFRDVKRTGRLTDRGWGGLHMKVA